MKALANRCVWKTKPIRNLTGAQVFHITKKQDGTKVLRNEAEGFLQRLPHGEPFLQTGCGVRPRGGKSLKSNANGPVVVRDTHFALRPSRAEPCQTRIYRDAVQPSVKT